jgi:hypothetical protein
MRIDGRAAGQKQRVKTELATETERWATIEFLTGAI